MCCGLTIADYHSTIVRLKQPMQWWCEYQGDLPFYNSAIKTGHTLPGTSDGTPLPFYNSIIQTSLPLCLLLSRITLPFYNSAIKAMPPFGSLSWPYTYHSK